MYYNYFESFTYLKESTYDKKVLNIENKSFLLKSLSLKKIFKKCLKNLQKFLFSNF